MTDPINKANINHNSRYLVKRHLGPVENYVRRAYEFFRNHCYPIRNISHLVTPGDSFVLILTPEDTEEKRVCGVITVNKVSDPPKVDNLSREDTDYLTGRILSRKDRKPPDDIIMDFCATRLNCTFTSAFSNQQFQIQLLKPTCGTDCPEYLTPPENPDPDLDRSIPYCILSRDHDLPPDEIEKLKGVDGNLRFRILPLDQFVREQVSNIRTSSAKGIMDVLDANTGLYDVRLKGRVIGTAKIYDIVEPFGDLETDVLQGIIRLIKDSNCGSEEDLKRIICNRAKDSVSTMIDSYVALSDQVDPQHRGKTLRVLFQAFTSNWENYTSSDLLRVRNVILPPNDNDAEVLEIFRSAGENPVFTFFRKNF